MPTSAPEIIVDCFRHARSTMQDDMDNPDITPFIGGRQNEIDLSLLGEEQARALGRCALREGLVPMRVYCSRAVRARRTYELAADVAGLRTPLIIDDRLQELDQGDWTNQPRALYGQHKEEMDRLGNAFAPPNGESMDMVDARFADFLDTREPLTTDGPTYIWVVGHGVATKIRAARLLGLSHEQTYKLIVDNVSRTRFVKEGGVWRVEFFNRSSLDNDAASAAN